MKKTIAILAVLILIFSTVASAQVRALVDDAISFPTNVGQCIFKGPIDISDCWVPAVNVGTGIGYGTDSMWVFKWSSVVYNSADSGAVAVDIGFSDVYAVPSKGAAGSTFDSLYFPNDTCCTAGKDFGVYNLGKYNKWFLGTTPTSTPKLCAADADTMVLHAEATGNQTEIVLAGRKVSANPFHYLYIRYTSNGAGSAGTNSAYNKFYHTVMVPDVRRN